jgi:hypothetical protein
MMTDKEILEKAKKLAAQHRARLQEPRVQRVLGFFAAKNLLIIPWIKPRPRVKLKREDVLYVSKYVEPRVGKVFPEAMARFPKSFY